MLRLSAALLTLLALTIHALGQSAEERSFSTSIADLQTLLQTEHQLVDELDKYATLLQWKVNKIRSGVTAIRAVHAKAQNDTEQYLANPLNGFSLVRRLHEDWIEWQSFLARPVGEDQIKTIEAHRPYMATTTDLKEAASAIYRLQKTYALNPTDMAMGLLNGKQYDAELGAIDCYAIGAQLFRDQIWHPALHWLYNAVELYQPSDLYDVLDFPHKRAQVLYAEMLWKHNRPKDALVLIETALMAHPNDVELLKKKSRLEIAVVTQTGGPISFATPVISDYELGCRGEYVRPSSRLHCRYNTTTTAFLKLAPLKMEEVSLNPYIVLYHGVISDAEITELKRKASTQLRRATVYSEQQQANVVFDTRTSKFAWFGDNTSATTDRINRRINDMTGFDLSTAEMLQVMNYGLGGHYETHYDFFNSSTSPDLVRMRGDRLSTVLFYMSDVDQGGATVFPNIRTAVLPQKGTAVVWYNLNNRGEGNSLTMHAACPVLVGSKWVCNKWIRERNQEFIRPCYKE